MEPHNPLTARLPNVPRRRPIVAALVAVLALLAAACGSDSAGTDSAGADSAGAPSDGADGLEFEGVTITVYSGRGEDLISPAFALFEERTGATVEARYGNSAEMALQIDTEGDNSPADVFISQSPGAVGFLNEGGRLGELTSATLDRVPEQYRSSGGNWVGITGRVRVLVYNTDLVDPADLPTSIFDLTQPEFAGRVGVAPSNGSFQDFVTAVRSDIGDDETLAWLAGMADNNSPNYPKNGAILDAVSRGEVEMGLVNHYYLVEALDEDPSLPAANHIFADGDLGSLLIVSAAAVVNTTEQAAAAEALVAFLLSDEAQALHASGEKEYPLVPGVPIPEGLVPLEELAAATIDLEVLAGGLSGTQSLIEQSGVQQ